MTNKTKTIAIIGNAGVGKTVLFERLSKGTPRFRKVPGCKVKLSEALLAENGIDRHQSSWSRIFQKNTKESDNKACSGFIPEMSPPRENAYDISSMHCSKCGGTSCSPDYPPKTSYPTPSIPALLVDTPGTATLFSGGNNECATRNFLMAGEADVLTVVADAKNLRRSLVLFLQAVEFRLPTVLVLNMMDEAQHLGLEFNLERLSKLLNVELSPVVATEGYGLESLKSLFDRAGIPSIRVSYPEDVERLLETLTELLQDAPISARALALSLLLGDRRAERILEETIDLHVANKARDVVRKAKETYRHPLEVIITDALYAEAGQIADQVTHRVSPEMGFLQRFGHYAAHPLYGSFIALMVILGGYLFVGEFGASFVVDFINHKLFQGILLPVCERLLAPLPWAFVRNAILDPNFGLIPTALFLALGMVLPILFFFYVFFGLLQDSGYLPRLSVLLDRALKRLGLTGKGVMPLVFGFSCITMAILSTRMLDTKKERVIVTFLLLIGFPCAPMLSMMLVVLEPLPWTAAATLFGLLILQVLVAGVVANMVLPGGRSHFLLELPPIRMPRIGVVVNRAMKQSYEFLKEALPAFMGASFLLFVLDQFGGLIVLERISRPVFHGMLGLPDQAVQVFIKTVIRRENGAAELSLVQNQFTALQMVVTLFVMTVMTPCINSAIVILKEQGAKICIVLLLMASAYALIAGTGLNLACHALGVTFS